LLQGAQATPRFLRAPWDGDHAHAFGPWRIGARTDPALPIDDPDAAAAHPPLAVIDESAATADLAAATPLLPDAAAGERVSAERLREAQDEAQARAEMQAERERESELLRHLAIELRALGEDPDRFFEPLRRLALHIAEQLVRSELRTSGHAIAQIVRQCLEALDAPSAKVVILLNPEDAALLEAMAPAFLEGLRLQPDPVLTRGSVRLRVDDTVLEDLIENRLEALVQPLMMPASRAGESVLVRELSTRGEPVSAPLPSPLDPTRRSRPAEGTIIDAAFMPIDETPPNPLPSAPTDPTGSA
jgi:flagellar biosynthesis/type III secretory pathway protein FliH